MLQYFALALMLVGIYGLLSQRNVIKMIVSLNVFEVGINIFIISVGYIKGGIAPILTSDTTSSLFVDPLPHALVLTSIVIGVGVTAFALALARKMYTKYGTYDLDEMGGDA